MNHAWLKLLPPFIRSRLYGRYDLQKILSNTGWLFGDRILRMGVGLFVGVWVARYLGPAQFGLYNYAIAFVALFSVLATLGLDSIVIRELVRDPEQKHAILGTAFILKLTGGILTLLLTTGVISLLRPDDPLVRWIIGITAASALFQAFDTIDLWFQSQVRSKYTVYAKNTAFVAIALTKVMLIQQQAPLIAFVWAGLAEVGLAAIGLIIAYRLCGNHMRLWRSSLTQGRSLLHSSWPLILGGLAVVIYMKIDQTMLGQMVGDEAVGIYTAAVRISEIWYFMPLMIVSSVFPSIVSIKKTNENLYYQRLKKLMSIMIILSLLISVPMILFAEPLILMIFGEDYIDAGGVLAIYTWASIFVFLGVTQNIWDVTEELTVFALYRTSIAAVMNVLLNLYLIPLYSFVGAAIATVISYAFAASILNLLHKKTRRIFFLQVESLLFWRMLAYNYETPAEKDVF